ncbi:hypothetical protein [Clostridium formicaceticum]|uniref:Uncharacterized protein n=1 Tax=Clostridium formicaceticum TaxID=1497 RepID=A0AAC9WHI5_9CLOT|nr:hypothetical protein [Clostridium formicaceticum]AOY74768.1 hypothetical protein BJL90_01635 [Clostridium formicaceticum]ARE89157.1 hypothetical protein CLFO_35630 [Clostridium formicaceticum]
MSKGERKKLFRSTKGSLLYLLGLTIVFVILHCDFWNWGSPNIYFGWMPQEFLYRLVYLVVLTPLANYSIQKLSWPLPQSKSEMKKG